MNRKYSHICFISDQNTAELAGVLVPEFEASDLHAIVTAPMQNKAENLEKACKRRGINYKSWFLENYDIPGVEQTLEHIVQAEKTANWLVNITGGTKIMALAAYSWASARAIPSFYIDAASGNILIFEAGRWNCFPVQEILDLEDLLLVNGFEIYKKQNFIINPAKQVATEALLDLCEKTKGKEALLKLNEWALKASAHPQLRLTPGSQAELARLVKICTMASQMKGGEKWIQFPDEYSRQWCHGRWLEEYVGAILSDLEKTGLINSWTISVKISGNGGINEIDALFTAHNRLYIVECKTTNLKKNSAPILYKADSLRSKLGGLYARSMLCAVHDLSAAELKRAQTLGLKTAIGAELKNLRKIIIEWVAQR